jgi:hypothetical protein
MNVNLQELKRIYARHGEIKACSLCVALYLELTDI